MPEPSKSIPPKKKLIEVALPLAEINDASAYDKMPGIGPHPKGIHHWWARLPLPAARAMLFSSVIDDPSEHPERYPTLEAQDLERSRLFALIRRLMQKKLHEHPEIYQEARNEMERHCGGRLPSVLDPFAGGGSIPLEANRLGFDAHAADLNPVAVLLNKCNLEIGPSWLNCPPVNGEARADIGGRESWQGLYGLANDLRYYGRLMGEEVSRKLANLYPKVSLPEPYGGGEANVVAWIWARTVASPNPAAHGSHVPLISTFWLNAPTKKKKPPYTWIEPIVDRIRNTYSFVIRHGQPPNLAAVKAGTKLGRGAKFKCILTDEPIEDSFLKREAQSGRLGMRLVAIVCDGKRGRVYLPATGKHQALAKVAPPVEVPTQELPYNARYLTPPSYGMTRICDLFTNRQLTAMTTLCDSIRRIQDQVAQDALRLNFSRAKAESYASAVALFLSLAIDRCSDFNNSLCRWSPTNQKVMNLFGRGAIPIVWDFAEANMLGTSVGGWATCSDYVAECLEVLLVGNEKNGLARQADAANVTDLQSGMLISTDPPYYDNIPYAAISDFFYVWLRRNVAATFPGLFETILVPKTPELTADTDRFEGDKEAAKQHFESGFRRVFTQLKDKIDPRYPLSVYYAFKQEDEEANESEEKHMSASIDLTTGWETLLEALVSSGFQITATWPIRASQQWRMRAMGANALASYIVLACRPRPNHASVISRREFLSELKRELPKAVRHLQMGHIAPVDLAQSSIGPGMAVFSRYAQVLETNGSPMSVRIALGLINQTLDEVLSEQEGEFDGDTRWALSWFEQNGFTEGAYGIAETLSKAKNTSVSGMVEAGIVEAKAGKVRLLKKEELPSDWDPRSDKRLTIWEATHHLVQRLENGEQPASELMSRLGPLAETARDLSYRLYTICERKKWAQEAMGYNALVLAWPDLNRLAQEQKAPAGPTQTELI